MSHSKEDVEATLAKLEEKRNRTERKAQMVTVQTLNRSLRRTLGTVTGQRIEAELDRRFRNLYKVRMKG
jgi:uncharacterized protein (DUF2267 family)